MIWAKKHILKIGCSYEEKQEYKNLPWRINKTN